MLRITDLEDRLKQAEDELNQANSEKEYWSGVAERRLKEIEQMKSEDDSKVKDAEINRLNEIIIEYQNKRDTLPAQRDRLRTEVDKMRKKLIEYERREKEDKAEIQKLRQQLIYRYYKIYLRVLNVFIKLLLNISAKKLVIFVK